MERLRQVSEADLAALGVLAELEADDAGIMRNRQPGRNADPDTGSRSRPGWLQLGLDDDEIEDVAERIEDLLELVDGGRLPIY